MKSLTLSLLVIFILITGLTASSADPNPAVNGESTSDPVFSVRRLLFAVGTNHGGADRIQLRYAGSDASSISQVFEELGGVEAQDRILLFDPDRGTFRNTLRAFGQLVNVASPHSGRVEVLFYYSGHSNEKGLLLNGELVEYKELRESIDAMDADVRIIILDSCSSGALTRLKGGQRRAPFLLDTSAQMTGHAFLTSSSENEAAQESDRINASFFTHALVSGLRGAADASSDGKVTLNEAYEFAFHATLARTEKTSSGPQHPGYNIQLVGAGDLVMTDLRGTSAGLVLHEEMFGRLHVRDSGGKLVVEVEKPAGRNIELGLEPGDYRVVLDQDGRFYGAMLSLDDGKRMELELANLSQVATELTTSRGDRLPAIRPAAQSPTDQPAIYRKFSFSVIPGIGTSGRDDENTINQFSLNLTLGRNRGFKDGLEIGTIGNWSLGDIKGCQIAGGINLVEGNAETIQMAGTLNRVWGNTSGVQMSGLVNSVAGDLEGAQIATLANLIEGELEGAMGSAMGNLVSGKFEGAQMAGLVNIGLDEFTGAQIAGWTNVAAKLSTGAQLSVGLNYTKRLVGAQIGGMNICYGQGNGFQGAAVGNYARNMRGVQLSLINVTGQAEGHQVGLVNVARHVTGTQIGLVNVADQVDGAPIGVLNLIRKGRHNINLWHSDTAEGNIGFKLGNQHVHSIFALGWQELGNDPTDRMFYGFGLGARIPKGRFFSEVDMIAYHIDDNVAVDNEDLDDDDEEIHMLSKIRLGFGWQFTESFAVVAGGCVNFYVSNRNEGEDFTHDTWRDKKSKDKWSKTWPGAYVGIQLF